MDTGAPRSQASGLELGRPTALLGLQHGPSTLWAVSASVTPYRSNALLSLPDRRELHARGRGAAQGRAGSELGSGWPALPLRSVTPGTPALGRNEMEQVPSELFGCYRAPRCRRRRGCHASVVSTGLGTCVLGSGRSLKSGRCCSITRVTVCKLYRQQAQAGLVGSGRIRLWGCPCEGGAGRLTWVFFNELSSLLKYS